MRLERVGVFAIPKQTLSATVRVRETQSQSGDGTTLRERYDNERSTSANTKRICSISTRKADTTASNFAKRLNNSSSSISKQ
jgi:hypothetical protein